MKLNPDCIRDILLTVENKSSFNTIWDYQKEDHQNELLENYSHDEIAYHIRQCSLSGFLNGVNYYDGGDNILVGDLTPEGHQFLANIRSNTNWNKTKEIAKSVGSDSLDVIKQISIGVIQSIIQSKLGQL